MKWVLLEKIKPNLFKNIQSTCLILAMEVMDHHLLEDLAKVGYKLDMEVNNFKHPFYNILAICWKIL
jgi:hypothetical protein